MISGVIVCPAAPLLIPGLADALAAEQTELRRAVAGAVSDLAGRSDRLLVIVAGPADSWLGRVADLGTDPYGRGGDAGPWPGGVHVAAALTRPRDAARHRLPIPDDHDAQPATRRSDVRNAGQGAMINTSGAGSRGAAAGSRGAVDLWAQQVADPTGPAGPNRAAVPDLSSARDLIDDAAATGVLALADGSRCHGDDAPGKRDDRSPDFESHLHAALGSGPADTRRWAATNRELGHQLGSTAPAVLAALCRLIELTTAPPGRSPLSDGGPGVIGQSTAEYFGAPYGVGYHLARWTR